MKKLLAFSFLVAMPLGSMAQRQVLDKQQLLQDVKVLAADSLEGRLSGSEGSRKAQDYIQQRFREIGLKPFNREYKQQFSFEARQKVVDSAINLVGYIPGKTDKAIVITAHYDHVGVRKGEVYNGADDNASGVGALLAAASYFKKHQPQHTLIFAALDGEELGLQGAKALVENPPVPKQNILLNVNMDMLSINDKGELYASGSYHYPQLKNILEQVKPRPQAKLLLGHDRPEQGHDDWTGQSDHYQFHKQGIPYVYFGVEDHPHYHKPSDEFKNVNKAFYPDATALVIDFLELADENLDDAGLPTWQ
ncbi:peptidase M28-like protein [Pontibacter ummariensis]|uniref:Peptidase family M28 n=1 Tax=Pontibacter ummariensis TaxID=1610492 RepID=A0A239JP11_9BACT|nr:M28 family peptidase [Pontibacter ummariensis]PRY07368.1 peptidase M28-like protein [Pontibacter ummariensis]SNT07756.1 Peptidase family M28 [Pontibacter ummariensis]